MTKTNQSETAIESRLNETINACKRSGVSLDFILPLLTDKPQEYITDVLTHLNRYADTIPADSLLGERLAAA